MDWSRTDPERVTRRKNNPNNWYIIYVQATTVWHKKNPVGPRQDLSVQNLSENNLRQSEA
jgi:hypothetical protein